MKNYKVLIVTSVVLSIVLILVSTLLLLLFTQNIYINIIFGTIIVAISINILSSIIIIIFFEYRDRFKQTKLEKLYNDIVLSKVTIAVKEFNELVYNMLKATQKEKFSDIDLECKYSNITSMYNQINKLDFLKPGYIRDIRSNKTISWNIIYFDKLIKLSATLKEIMLFYLPIIDHSIAKDILFIANMKEKLENDLYISMIKDNPNVIVKDTIDNTNEYKYIIFIINFKKLLSSVKNIIEYINNYRSTNVFKISDKLINRDNVSPKFASGL
jgi:hypothetical protein